MKLFQRLLVAGAAMSMIAPIGAQASNINLEDMNSYASSSKSKGFNNNFSTIQPSDWAFKAIKDLAKKLEVPLEFSEFPPPQSSVALSSVVNATQWEEIGGVIASTITPNSHWPSIQQCCADGIQVELKLKKVLEIPNADEIDFPQPEPAVDEEAEARKAAEAEENSKVTEALEEMVKASEEKKKAPAKKKAASTKKAEPEEESPEEPASEEASE